MNIQYLADNVLVRWTVNRASLLKTRGVMISKIEIDRN